MLGNECIKTLLTKSPKWGRFAFDVAHTLGVRRERGYTVADEVVGLDEYGEVVDGQPRILVVDFHLKGKARAKL